MPRLPRSGGRGVSFANDLVGVVSARWGGGGRIPPGPLLHDLHGCAGLLLALASGFLSHDACSLCLCLGSDLGLFGLLPA